MTLPLPPDHMTAHLAIIALNVILSVLVTILVVRSQRKACHQRYANQIANLEYKLNAVRFDLDVATGKIVAPPQHANCRCVTKPGT